MKHNTLPTEVISYLQYVINSMKPEKNYLSLIFGINIESEFNCVISGTKHGAGFTKFVELIPNKNDSVSGALYDNLFQGICAGSNPLPGNLVL